MPQAKGTAPARHQQRQTSAGKGAMQAGLRPSEVTPPPMREVTKGWFSNRERLVPRAEIEADERRK